MKECLNMWCMFGLFTSFFVGSCLLSLILERIDKTGSKQKQMYISLQKNHIVNLKQELDVLKK